MYRGDIIQHLFKNCNEKDRYIIEWNQDDLRYCFKNTYTYQYMALEDMYDDYTGEYSIEVIGNIHDNSELIEKESN